VKKTKKNTDRVIISIWEGSGNICLWNSDLWVFSNYRQIQRFAKGY